MEFSTIPPRSTSKPTPFQVSIPDSEVARLYQHLDLADIAPETYENLKEDGSVGISHAWLSNALRSWKDQYDWRQTEKRINSFPNYQVSVTDEGGTDYNIHFVALFSKNPDAIPIVMLHGWPGSFMEFLPCLDIVRKRYTPSTLPYHIIVPSIVGYCFSAGPSVKSNTTVADVAWVTNSMMIGLGFADGYVAQGGDIGSYLARILGSKFEECKAVHCKFRTLSHKYTIPDTDAAGEAQSTIEETALERTKLSSMTEFAYALEHATRPATIGFVLSSNPVALLSWIGEKYLTWSHQKPPLSVILDAATVYWFTKTIARCLYPYRDALHSPYHELPEYFIHKPLGFSFFPYEIAPTPISWVRSTGNLEWSRIHSEGGHFAALETPDAFLQDIEDFVVSVWVP
ncbi:putative epoxide hydrolase [Lophium mytilinum]|uniref:Putative epoxide hydrolase n=1 Tax=Lophium mytilinum TaxID=390894 RepID=A0A6A6R9Q8_9PEZI|nr:putative epoxide hydrolase [Lophium mytilinum]